MELILYLYTMTPPELIGNIGQDRAIRIITPIMYGLLLRMVAAGLIGEGTMVDAI